MGSWATKSRCAAFASVLACGSPAHTTPAGMSLADTSAMASSFEFDSLDARKVSSGALLGKPAVIVFVTTYDPISQQQVTYDLGLAAELPEVQFVLVALQDASARELVELYRQTMKVPFPVALGDAATIAGGGTLGDVHQVPTTIVLARDGHVAWRHPGGVMPTELRRHLKDL